VCVACAALNQFFSILDAPEDPMAFGCSRCNAQLISKWLYAKNAHTFSSEEKFELLCWQHLHHSFWSPSISSVKVVGTLLTNVRITRNSNTSSLFSIL